MEEIICFVDGENMDVLGAMGRIESRECEQGSGARCFLEEICVTESLAALSFTAVVFSPVQTGSGRHETQSEARIFRKSFIFFLLFVFQ